MNGWVVAAAVLVGAVLLVAPRIGAALLALVVVILLIRALGRRATLA